MAKITRIFDGNHNLDGRWGERAEVEFSGGHTSYHDVSYCPTCKTRAIHGTLNGELEDGDGGLEFLDENEWGITVHCTNRSSTDCGED